MACVSAEEIAGMTRNWIESNPAVWKWMEGSASECAAAKRHFSVAKLVEQARYEMWVNGIDGYKINHDIRGALSRLLRVTVPECTPYIEVRKSKLDDLDFRALAAEWGLG